MKVFKSVQNTAYRLAAETALQEAEMKEALANPLWQRRMGYALLGLLVLAVCLAPNMAFAQSQPWETTAEKTYDLIMSIARWVAIIAVVGCGLAAMFGKLSWEWAGKIIIGLVLVFGGTYLVDYFADGIN